jgi:uncharacterized membrane protein YeaQ/YmgE (transglycosylase-associated protein family)
MTLGALLIAVVVIFLLAKTIPLFSLLIALITWGVVGMVAGKLVRGRDFGLVGNVILGFFGGFLGTFLFALLGLWPILKLPFIGYGIAGVVGSVLLIFLMRLIDRNFAR